MLQLCTPKIYMISICDFIFCLSQGRLGCRKMWGREIGAHNVDVFWGVVRSFDKGEPPRDPFPVPMAPVGPDGSPFATATPPSSRPFWLGSYLPFWLGSSLLFWLGSRLSLLFGSTLNSICWIVTLPSLLPLAVHLKPTCKETINQPKLLLSKY